jgi:hypothetical protein
MSQGRDAHVGPRLNGIDGDLVRLPAGETKRSWMLRESQSAWNGARSISELMASLDTDHHAVGAENHN